jgi:hypothetical protein
LRACIRSHRARRFDTACQAIAAGRSAKKDRQHRCRGNFFSHPRLIRQVSRPLDPREAAKSNWRRGQLSPGSELFAAACQMAKFSPRGFNLR